MSAFPLIFGFRKLKLQMENTPKGNNFETTPIYKTGSYTLMRWCFWQFKTKFQLKRFYRITSHMTWRGTRGPMQRLRCFKVGLWKQNRYDIILETAEKCSCISRRASRNKGEPLPEAVANITLETTGNSKTEGPNRPKETLQKRWAQLLQRQ